VSQGEELSEITRQLLLQRKPSFRTATKERNTESTVREQSTQLSLTSFQKKSPKRFISFLISIENEAFKRVIGVALAQSLFFIAKLNHI
tara:strand:- start:2323 stop:2589 length:267 start_codon:yes stop_codon:yes gene_type:complete